MCTKALLLVLALAVFVAVATIATTVAAAAQPPECEQVERRVDRALAGVVGAAVG